MDDNLSNEQASNEALVTEEQQSEVTSTEETPKDEADTGTESDGTADDSEADHSEDDQDEDEQPKRKRPSGVERLKRRNEALEAELAQIRSRPPVDSGNLDAAIKAEIGEPPKEADYADYLAFEQARTAYETAKLVIKPQIKRALEGQAAQSAARQAEAFEDYSERLESAEKAIPGLKATITKANIQISGTLTQLIVESEKGPLLAHHLAKNPAKAAELNRLPPLKAAMEVARLEHRLSLPKPNTATKAPAPTAPVKGGAGVMSPSQEIDAYISKTYRR
ncbi:hypothetical protein [Microvirga alba]|uniref:Scaffolding protein n=1 Tax=Microvirga alba TaxID=2791025 RepID=A0A931BT21_9HYPH|nr:hypothetical protein [Microvirga alba]MBF9234690.1 hypothetical protein [Microvirga alba]